MAVLPYGLSAVTVKLTGVPAVAVAGATTTKWVAAAALTVIAPLVPRSEAFTVSVAVNVWLPAVFRVAPSVKVWTPSSPATRCSWPADGRRVAAGEVDRAGVAGGRVAVLVFRGDREGERRARGGRGRRGHHEVGGRRRADRD